jgi:hypothetical protein
MNPDMKEEFALMTAEEKNLKKSMPDEVSSSEGSSKKKRKTAGNPKDGTVTSNHKPHSTMSKSGSKITCRMCGYCAKTNDHLKSHFFYHHLSVEVRTFD